MDGLHIDRGSPSLAILGFASGCSIPWRRLGVDLVYGTGRDVERVDALEEGVDADIPLGGAKQDEAAAMVEAQDALGVRQKTAGGRE